VMKQAMQLTKVTRQRLDKMGTADEGNPGTIEESGSYNDS